jgi:glucose/arabinose dehydrogenase
MIRRFPTALTALALAAVPGAPSSGAPAAPTVYASMPGVRLETVATAMDRPLYLTAPRGDARLFIVEQGGRIRVFRSGRLNPTPFLDLSAYVSRGGEQGLLSMAFHPDYARNGFFFIDYTDRRGDTRIVRYHVSGDPDRADRASATDILKIDQPYANHNGGLVMFGPDGMLWIGMGDGGSGGDPHGNGQNLQSLLGKLLRIDVDHGEPYAIPPDNPFVHRSGARPEIWAYGLRNPWRFCFDRTDSLLYIADVGQDLWEEIDAVPLRFKGLNFGWNLMEGDHPYKQGASEPRRLVRPIAEYGHGEGCSITGGFVYRGRLIPDLYGQYVFSDYCTGWLRSLRYQEGHVDQWRLWQKDLGNVSSFGEDAAGELYVISLGGRVAKLVRATARPAGR